MPVESYPWRFSSVISVGSHEEPDPLTFFYNPAPPVEFFARGVDVEVAWLGGGMIRCTGNSFATPHIERHLRADLSKHPELTPFQLKSVLYLIATNVGGGDDDDDLRAAVAAGVLGSEESSAAAAVDRRGRAGDLRRESLVGLPARRGGGRAHLRSRGGRGRRRRSSASAFPRAPASPAGCSSRGSRSSSRTLDQDPRFAREARRRPATCRRA